MDSNITFIRSFLCQLCTVCALMHVVSQSASVNNAEIANNHRARQRNNGKKGKKRTAHHLAQLIERVVFCFEMEVAQCPDSLRRAGRPVVCTRSFVRVQYEYCNNSQQIYSNMHPGSTASKQRCLSQGWSGRADVRRFYRRTSSIYRVILLPVPHLPNTRSKCADVCSSVEV